MEQIKKSIDMPKSMFDEIQVLADEKMISWNAMCRILLKDHLAFLKSNKYK